MITFKVAILGQDTYENVSKIKKHIFNWKENFYDKLEIVSGGGKFGVEYNKGSAYWRSFTYAEDTMIGSKLAARGDAFDIYWTQPIIDKTFTMQVRYTQINYDYTGSNAFFGDGGTPMSMSQAKNMGMDPVETAKDLRVYFRYRY